jgi:hypothetical protein
MTEPTPSDTEKTAPPKQTVSPARHAIGAIVLIAVVIVGGLQVWSMVVFNSTVDRLNKRMEDETKLLLTQKEAEEMIQRTPDDAGSDFVEGSRTFLKKTYTWKGLLKSYTLTAYYAKDKEASLYRIETEGAKFEPEPATTSPPIVAGEGGGHSKPSGGMTKGRGGSSKTGKGKAKGTSKADGKSKADEKSKTEAPKAGADEKAKAGADDNASPPAPQADEKPKADGDDKAAAPAKPD